MIYWQIWLSREFFCPLLMTNLYLFLFMKPFQNLYPTVPILLLLNFFFHAMRLCWVGCSSIRTLTRVNPVDSAKHWQILVIKRWFLLLHHQFEVQAYLSFIIRFICFYVYSTLRNIFFVMEKENGTKIFSRVIFSVRMVSNEP